VPSTTVRRGLQPARYTYRLNAPSNVQPLEASFITGIMGLRVIVHVIDERLVLYRCEMHGKCMSVDRDAIVPWGANISIPD
jgi:hypothetical protein